MPNKNIIILGAGLTGLSTAYHLEKFNQDCRVFEKEKTIGGLCRSKNVNGFIFDCDGHLLHFKRNGTLGFIRNLLKDKLNRRQRNASIYSFGRFTRYPFQANLYGLPLSVIKDCLLGFIKANDGLPKIKNPSFLDWINQSFGEGIARHFMIPYNKKFWKAPLDRITCDWIGSYIPLPRLSQLIEGTLGDSRINFGYNSYFWYPSKGGIQELVFAFASEVANIFTSFEATKIDIKNKQVHFKNGKKENYDILVSTLPLPEVARIIKSPPRDITRVSKKLKYICVFNLNLGVDRANISDRHWVYFPEKKFVFYRVGFPNNFSSFLSPPGTSSLYAEVSYLPCEKIDEEKVTEKVIRDLIKSGIIRKDDKILTKDTNHIKYGYVIYDADHSGVTEKILKFLVNHDIYSVGRFGSWRYMTMEDAIVEGREAAQKIYKI